MQKHLLILVTLLLPFLTEGASKESMRIFSGNANPALAEAVAMELGVPLGKSTVGRFNDGEINISYDENIRNTDVFVVQSTCPGEDRSVNDNLMELMLMIRTAKRASANSVTAVIPYYGYARQDRKVKPRVPISASDVAMLLESAGADRVLAVDLHCGQIQGFFHNAPVDNLYASTMFIPYFAQMDLTTPVVVSPDAGGVARAKKFQEGMIKRGHEASLAVIVKERSKPGVVASVNLVGSVEGSDAIIVDDLCDTGGTLCKAAEELKANGARRVFACITHPIFTDPAYDRIKSSVLTEVVVSDTIPLRKGAPENVTQLSIAPLVAQAISRIQTGESVSVLFVASTAPTDWESQPSLCRPAPVEPVECRTGSLL
jgi:ribose-phosphate pyrophosphokinase